MSQKSADIIFLEQEGLNQMMTTFILSYSFRSCSYFGVNCQNAIFFIFNKGIATLR